MAPLGGMLCSSHPGTSRCRWRGHPHHQWRTWLAAQDPPRDRRGNTGDPGGRGHLEQCRRRANAARTPEADRPGSGDRHRHSRVASGCAIGSSTAGDAYDTRGCHDAIAARGAAAVIPPRRTARPWKPDTAGARARNEILRASQHLGRTLWRNWSGYHRRSRVETKVNCVKQLGQRLMSRDFDRQVAEVQIRAFAAALGPVALAAHSSTASLPSASR